ncbi:MAG: amino acid ABC transporter substrate-binding protein, partial [bacterium]|nr:amino acid ABC transporter substrate-binding protein [bacterium]
LVFRKDNIKEWKGPETLNNKTAVWLRGYDCDKNPHMKKIKLKSWLEIDSHKEAWGMLKKGRMDFYIDALVDINLYIKKNKIDMTPYQIETLWGEKMYMVFAKSERSKKLIEVYDKRVIELFKSGELKKLFKKWNNKYSPEAWQE